jgi:DNA-binding response OmpR family regulator
VLSKKTLILIVEDEYFLKADLEQVLNDAGFATEAVASGEEALALFLEDTRKYDVLITDVRLRGTLNGWDLARQVRDKEPAFPVIYVTGSNVEEWTSHRVPNSILIPRPFAPRQLINAVCSLLNIKALPTT